MTDWVLIEKDGGVLTITLNRPEKKNALTSDSYKLIGGAIDAANDDPSVRVILIQAKGDMFTAGHDVSEFAAINAGGEQEARPSGEPLLLALANARKPLVAAVHGRAVGIGLTMLLHCDLVYIAEDARLSAPFVDLAVVPEAGSSLLLPARIGHVRAFAVFALGQQIDARQAVDWGLANEAVKPGTASTRARQAALQLAAKAGEALAVTKRLLRDGPGLSARIEEESAHFRRLLKSGEAGEAFAAFFERRAPDFSRFR